MIIGDLSVDVGFGKQNFYNTDKNGLLYLMANGEIISLPEFLFK